MELQIALGNAIGEVTLVLFTTIGPAGTVAYLIMAFTVVFKVPFGSEARYRVRKFLIIPLVVTITGLVASATHLGNPSNALYVLSRVGSSPLSNEVTAAVVFLAFASVFWALTFALRRSEACDRAMFALLAVSGLAFLLFVSLAYDVETIVTWHLPQFVVSQWGCALASGPALAFVGFAAARYSSTGLRLERALLVVSVIGGLLAVLCFASAWAQLQGMRNSVVSAASLVPFYPYALMAFAACVTGGIAIEAVSLRRWNSVSLPCALVASLLLCLGVFLMRFGFYMLHMTAGIAF